MGQKIEFMVVDDHPLFRQGLVSVIENYERYKVIGEANTIDEAIKIVDAIRHKFFWWIFPCIMRMVWN